MVSGHIVKVPEHKNKALWKEMLVAPTGREMASLPMSCARHGRMPSGLQMRGHEHARHPEGLDVWVGMCCRLVCADASLQPVAKVESSSKQVAAAKLKISDAHLLAVVKLVHGSARSKNDLVQELMEAQPDIPKSRGEKIIATVAQKKVEKGASRWVLLEETLKRSAFIAEIAKDAWKVNTSKPAPKKTAAASGGVASVAAEPAAPPIDV